jgi:hypothetical protein
MAETSQRLVQIFANTLDANGDVRARAENDLTGILNEAGTFNLSRDEMMTYFGRCCREHIAGLCGFRQYTYSTDEFFILFSSGN